MAPIRLCSLQDATEMAVLAEQLVGRADELGRLDAAMRGLADRRAVAVEVAGEPGIGKTRLLSELGQRSDARAHLVLSGRASELERDLPFWVFVDALDEYVRGLQPGRLRGLDPAVRAELAHVLPSLASEAATRGGALHHDRYRTHRAVRDLLELVARAKPLVLLLDDLHWADAGSVELLGALLRRPPARVLIALAARPRQRSERLSAALDAAHRTGTLVRLNLAPLNSDDAHALLGDDAGCVASALIAESGGNPFYLEQLRRSWQRAGRPAPSGATSLSGVEVPPTVAAALAAELSLLSPRARRVLEGASVAGDPFEPELAAAAAAVPEALTVEALDELLDLDLVRLTDVPRRFRFRHPLVRRAVYAATPGAWRLGAHERSASALATRGAPPSGYAHHVERSARQGDASAVAVLRTAGHATAHRAPATAARWFAGALRLMPEEAPAQERVELLLDRAGALAATGQFAEAHAALLQSLALLPREAHALRVRLTTACAGVERLMGHHDEAHARLFGALDAVRDATSPHAVALMIELAVDGFVRMEYSRMRDWAARALEPAKQIGDPALIAAALSVLALARACTGAMEEAERYRSEAAARVDAMADEELATRLDAAVNLATAELYSERFEPAMLHAERAVAVGRRSGQGELFPVLFPLLGVVALMQGRLAEASKSLGDAIEAARLSGNVPALAANLLTLSQTELAKGDVADALRDAQESVDLARGPHESLLSAWAAVALAAAQLEAGEPRRAADTLRDSAGGDELPHIPAAWRASCLELLTRCWLAAGSPAAAATASAGAAAAAAAVGLELSAAMADRAAAAVALAAGEPAAAAQRGLASAAGAEAAGAPIEAAVARTVAGKALAAAGDSQRAGEELARAAAELDACGAMRYRADSERELRKLGRPVRRRTRAGNARGSGVELLTERELQVARLVVDRRTNSGIAAELFLSLKTVESHLRNSFVKLDVSSRVELARMVERSDAAQT